MDYKYFYRLTHKLFRSKLFFALEIVVSAILGITLVFPIIGSLLALNELLRLCFKTYLWFVYDGKIKLSDDECGNNYWIIPTKERHTVLYLGEVEGTLDVESVRENYQKHTLENKTYSKLKYIWQKKWPYTCLKICDTFDIRNHVRVYPGTEERTVTENELMKNILPDLSKDMTDSEKPQWEEVIIPYYQKPQSLPSEQNEIINTASSNKETISLRIIRMHHSYMDGASTLLMIANTFTDEGDSFPYVIDPCKPLKISKLSMFLYKLTSISLFSSTLIRYLLSPPFTRPCRFTVQPNSTGDILFGWTNKIPMDYFQNIKDKTGVSMPAIVSAVLTSAIRNLELEHPITRRNCKDLKDAVTTVSDTHPLWIVAGMFPYCSNTPRNQHVVIETQVNTSDISCCERLALINRDLGRLAKNPMVIVFYWFVKAIGRAPRIISEVILKLAFVPTILSNVPLCTRNIKLWGKECTSIVGWVPLLSNTGLGVVSVRYADHFRYCIQVDSTTVNQEELDYFVQQIEQQVEQLFLETAQLDRKISTESSLFDHEMQNKPTDLLSPDDGKAKKNDDINNIENDESNGLITGCINNNNNNFDKGFSLGGAITSANYSIILKLKDSLEQIRVGIRKIKEQ